MDSGGREAAGQMKLKMTISVEPDPPNGEGRRVELLNLDSATIGLDPVTPDGSSIAHGLDFLLMAIQEEPFNV